MIDIETMNHRQLIDELFRHCKKRASGTVFFNLDSGQSARLVLNHGVIHWIAYEDLRGREAIESMRGIGHARFSFNPHLRMAIGNQQLPSTTYILKRLYKQTKKPLTVVDLPVEREKRQDTEQQINNIGEIYFDQDKVRTILEKEALEYLGPMARVVCGEYLKPMPSQLSTNHVRQLIAAFKMDINDEKKGTRFKTKVMQALEIH